MRWPLVWRSTFEAERAARLNGALERQATGQRIADMQSQYDATVQVVGAQQGKIGDLQGRGEMQQHNLSEMRRMYDALQADYRTLLEKYHALRVDGANAPWSVPASDFEFGPLTKAALRDMEKGQSRMVKQAQRAKATTLWLEHRDHEEQDALVATLVRAGEVFT